MCGLVGVITKHHNGFSKEQCDIFNDLLYIDALRGMDSTGVFLVDYEGNVDVAKEASASPVFRTRTEYKDLLQQALRKGRAMVGHNRAATKGSVIDANAHPFVVDNRITLVHNGTLWGDFKKLTDKHVDVDSHAIAHKIHECGDNVEEALQQISGAYALIWHDFKNNTLNFVRNTQRPLHYVETQNGWIWASEANMIAWVLARYNLKPLTKINEMPASVLTSYNFSNNSWAVESNDIKLTAPITTWAGNTDGFALYDDYCGYTPPPAETKSTALVLPLQKPTQVDESVLRARSTGRSVAAEQELAFKHGLNLTMLEFSNQKNAITERQLHKATCLDFDTVRHGDSTLGYWLYGRLSSNPNFLVRGYLPAGIDEMDLLDWVLSTKEMLFYVTGATWRCYNNAAHGAGYAVLPASKVQEMEVIEA